MCAKDKPNKLGIHTRQTIRSYICSSSQKETHWDDDADSRLLVIH